MQWLNNNIVHFEQLRHCPITPGLVSFLNFDDKKNYTADELFSFWEQHVLDPDLTEDLLIFIGYFLYKKQDKKLAESFFGFVNSQHYLNEEICILMAQLALYFQLWGAVENSIAYATSFDPVNIDYYLLISHSLERRGYKDQAYNFMTAVCQKLPGNYDCLMRKAVLCRNIGKDNEAADLCALALEINPLGIEAHVFDGGKAVHNTELNDSGSINTLIWPEIHEKLYIEMAQSGKIDDFNFHYCMSNNLLNKDSIRLMGLPKWNGKKLSDHKIIIIPDKGLGDEIFLLQRLHGIPLKNLHLTIVCDQRLKSIICKSYPDVTVIGTNEFSEIDPEILHQKFDYYCPFSEFFHKLSLNDKQSLIQDVSPFHSGLKSKQSFVNQLSEQKIKIGVSWRCGMMDADITNGYYVGLKNIIKLIHDLDAEFICLQYDYTDEELSIIQSETGKELTVLEGLDLKQDLAGNLEVMRLLDVIIGPNSAVQMLALSSSRPVYILDSSLPWWTFGKAHTPQAESQDVEWIILTSEAKENGTFYWDKVLDEICYMIRSRFFKLMQGKG